MHLFGDGGSKSKFIYTEEGRKKRSHRETGEVWDDLTQRCSIFPVRPSQTRLYTPQPNTTSPAISAAARRCCAGLLAASMDSSPPLLASSPRSALPDHPQHGQATGSPPPPLLTSAPCSLLPAEPLLHGQATGAPMEAQAPPPVPAAAAFCPPSLPRSGSSGTSLAAAPP